MKPKRFLKKRPKNNIVLKKQPKGKLDLLLIFLTCFLSLFGLLMIFNTSFPSAIADFGDKYHYFKEQLQWIAIAFLSMLFFMHFDYHRLYNFAVPFLLIALILLVAVFIPGIGVNVLGASRWIKIGFINFQPAEFAKLSLIIYLASWFSFKERKRLISFLILMVIFAALIVLEPDLGTAAIVAFTALVLYFLSGASIWHFFFILPLIAGSGAILAIISPYRFARIMTFLNPNIDPQGASYHIQQILLALGSGGWVGLGFGQSKQKFAYLPEAATDSIFAIAGEELGFIGASIVIVLFAILFIRGFKIAFKSSDRFGLLLSGGLISALIFQTLVNLGSMVALIPLTGVPLPFLSYGGSSLLISFSMIGILLNISKQS